MRLSEITYDDATPVDGYGPGFFRVGGQVIEGGVLIHAGGAGRWAGYEDRASLLALAGDVDVLLIGTGADVAHIPADVRAALEAAGLGLEIMASPSAARTYNVLLSEGRRIALAALPV